MQVTKKLIKELDNQEAVLVPFGGYNDRSGFFQYLIFEKGEDGRKDRLVDGDGDSEKIREVGVDNIMFHPDRVVISLGLVKDLMSLKYSP